MKNGTWFNCTAPTGCWECGEYLIEKAPNNDVVIWVKRQAGVTGIKTLKAALQILNQEFKNVEKINR